MAPPLLSLLFTLSVLRGASSAYTSTAKLIPSKSGAYVTVPNYALNPASSTVYDTVKGKSGCNCIALCFVDIVCLGVSYDASFLCSFNNAGAMATNSSMPSEGSTSVFWTDDVSMSTFSTGSGGGVYAFIDSEVGWATARFRCESMPGFQLAELTLPPQGAEALLLAETNGDQWIGLKTDGVNPYFVNSHVPWEKSVLFSYPYKLNGDVTDKEKLCYFLKKEEVDQDVCGDKELPFLCQSKYEA